MRSAWRHDIDYSKRKLEPGILTGVRTICRYMKIGPQTFYKLQTEHGLPVMQLPDGRWCTSRNLIDDWIVSRWKAQKAGLEPRIVEGEDVEGAPLLNVTKRVPGRSKNQGGKESYEAHLS